MERCRDGNKFRRLKWLKQYKKHLQYKKNNKIQKEWYKRSNKVLPG